MGGRQKSAGEQIARTAPGVASTVARVGGMGGGSWLGPLSMFGGGFAMGEAGADMADNGVGAGNSWDMLRGMGSTLSGWAGFSGAAGTALTAGGGHAAGAGVGTAFGASALGTVGAVAGAGLAGYGVGTLMSTAMDSDASANSGWFGQDQYTGENRSFSDAVTDSAVSADNAVNNFIGGSGGGVRDTIGDWAGTAVGAGTAIGGSIAGAGVGLASAAYGGITSFFD